MGIGSIAVARAIESLPLPAGVIGRNGERFFVDAVNGLDTGPGTRRAPLRTIMAAHGRAASGRGDQIFVMPGSYAENVAITKDNIALIGGFPGRYGWPDLEGAAGVPLTVTAQGFHMDRVRCAAPAGQHACRLRGNGYVVRNCVFHGDGASCLVLGGNPENDSYTASEGLVEDCVLAFGATGLRFLNPGDGAAGLGYGPSDVTVRRCHFSQITSQDIIGEFTAGATGNAGCFFSSEILECRFIDLSKAVYITLTAGDSNNGLIAGNWFAEKVALNATKIALEAGIVFAGNFDAVGIVNGSAF